MGNMAHSIGEARSFFHGYRPYLKEGGGTPPLFTLFFPCPFSKERDATGPFYFAQRCSESGGGMPGMPGMPVCLE